MEHFEGAIVKLHVDIVRLVGYIKSLYLHSLGETWKIEIEVDSL